MSGRNHPHPIRILLADDHAVVRRGLRLVLESEPDLRVVSEAGDGAEAVRRAVKDDVDLAILDISMPLMTGLQAGERSLLRRTLDHPAEPAATPLTERESQILSLIADGNTTLEIAEMLMISPRTVERHRDNLLEKLHLRNRIDLTRYAIRNGLVEP